jgi:hypothetical protein
MKTLAPFKDPKASAAVSSKNRCHIKVLFDNGHAPLLLELVAYDTLKTLKAVLKNQVCFTRMSLVMIALYRHQSAFM